MDLRVALENKELLYVDPIVRLAIVDAKGVKESVCARVCEYAKETGRQLCQAQLNIECPPCAERHAQAAPQPPE